MHTGSHIPILTPCTHTQTLYIPAYLCTLILSNMHSHACWCLLTKMHMCTPCKFLCASMLIHFTHTRIHSCFQQHGFLLWSQGCQQMTRSYLVSSAPVLITGCKITSIYTRHKWPLFKGTLIKSSRVQCRSYFVTDCCILLKLISWCTHSLHLSLLCLHL